MPSLTFVGAVLALRAAPLHMQAPAATRIPGNPSQSDEADFAADPKAFCAQRLRAHGSAFATGASGGATFVGDAAALAAVGTSATTVPGRPALAPPFAMLPAGEADAFDAHAEAFNSVCYSSIFDWIPKYKEAGFSTFRFEDFIDGRVRKMRPSVRTMMLRATAPYVFGVSADELAPTLGFESDKEGNKALHKAYASYASSRLGASAAKGPFGFDASSLLGGLGGGGDVDALEAGVARWAASRGVDAETALWRASSSIEQATALLCNLIAAVQEHPAAAAALTAEQASVRDLGALLNATAHHYHPLRVPLLGLPLSRPRSSPL